MARTTSIKQRADCYQERARVIGRWIDSGMSVLDPDRLILEVLDRPGRMPGSVLRLLDGKHRAEVRRRIRSLS